LIMSLLVPSTKTMTNTTTIERLFYFVYMF
jgi:hypothetical protein